MVAHTLALVLWGDTDKASKLSKFKESLAKLNKAEKSA